MIAWFSALSHMFVNFVIAVPTHPLNWVIIVVVCAAAAVIARKIQ
jgi:hypothetical protein